MADNLDKEFQSILFDSDLPAGERKAAALRIMKVQRQIAVEGNLEHRILCEPRSINQRLRVLRELFPEDNLNRRTCWVALMSFHDVNKAPGKRHQIAGEDARCNEIVFINKTPAYPVTRETLPDSPNPFVREYLNILMEAHAREDRGLRFYQPATRADIQMALAWCDFPLPDLLIDFWQCVNGMPDEGRQGFVAADLPITILSSNSLLRTGCLIPVNELVSEYLANPSGDHRVDESEWGNPWEVRKWDKRIKCTWSNDKRIPIFATQGLLVMIDYDPGEEGAPGQIVGFEQSFYRMEFIAKDFQECMEKSMEILRTRSSELF